MSQTSRNMDDLEEAFLDNAYAFLRRGAAGAVAADGADDEQQSLAFAVVDIATAVELMLKARLAREHWTLVMAKLGRTRQELLEGSAPTVTPAEAIARLSTVVGIEFRVSRPHKTFAVEIDHVFKMRNRAVHFTLANEDPTGIRAQIFNALGFALDFLESEWGPSLKEEVSAVTRDLAKLAEFVAKRMEMLEDQLAAAPLAVTCPGCEQDALLVGNAEPAHCLFCLRGGEDEANDELAQDYVSEILGISRYMTVKDGGEWPVEECPNCGAEALVPDAQFVRPAVTAPDWICFTCGTTYGAGALERCNRCSRLTESEEGICTDCIDDLMDRD